MPAEYVRPYVKSNKNDFIDAEAIAEAVLRPSMRFVPIRRMNNSIFRRFTGSSEADPKIMLLGRLDEFGRCQLLCRCEVLLRGVGVHSDLSF